MEKMLSQAYDLDRHFDYALRRVLPYFIFSREFEREELANMMRSLTQYHREKNTLAFENLLPVIDAHIENTQLDDQTDVNVYLLDQYLRGTYENYQKIDQRLRKVEEQLKIKKISEIPMKGVKTLDGRVEDVHLVETIDITAPDQNNGFHPTDIQTCSLADKSANIIKNEGVTKKSMVIECLVNASRPLMTEEIAERTGLSVSEVSKTIGNTRTSGVKIITTRMPRPYMRNDRVVNGSAAFYSIPDSEKNRDPANQSQNHL